jgi:septal ring-binding cell division protein DamX
MAGTGKRGGGDRILESRHLVGLFLGVVLLCGVFFTLGYVMGRTQYAGAVHASDALTGTLSSRSPAPKEKPAEAPATPPPAEWDFYAKKDNNHLEPAAKISAPAPSTSSGNDLTASPPAAASAAPPTDVAAKPPARFQPPRLLKGSIVLQVAALTHESDALAMADALQQKKFPSFVVAPATDNFYRVQIGPYANEQAADAARSALDRAGFKAIIKR